MKILNYGVLFILAAIILGGGYFLWKLNPTNNGLSGTSAGGN